MVAASAVWARVVGPLLLVVWGCDVVGVPELGVERVLDADDDGNSAPGQAAEQAADCVLGDPGDVGDFFEGASCAGVVEALRERFGKVRFDGCSVFECAVGPDFAVSEMFGGAGLCVGVGHSRAQ